MRSPFAKKYLLFFIFMLLPFLLIGQENIPVFERLSIEHGLSQSSVGPILQDSKGFMWFGTSSGVNKYDGYSIIVYKNNHQDSTSLSDDWVTTLCEIQNGDSSTLWLGTINGVLNRFDRLNEQFEKIYLPFHKNVAESPEIDFSNAPAFFSFLNENSITALVADKSGNLWIGTWGNGLFKYNTHKQEISPVQHASNNHIRFYCDRILNLQMSRSGELWIGTFGGGVCRFSPSTEQTHNWRTYKKEHNNATSLSDDRVTSLYIDKSDNVWIGTKEGFLHKFNREKENFIIYATPSQNMNGFSGHDILAMLEDSDGNFWVGTFGGGLSLFDRKTGHFQTYIHDPYNPTSLSGNDVLSIYEDRSGIIWIATQLGKGISKFDRKRKKFRHFTKEPNNANSLNDNIVYALHEDANGVLWIGTQRGGLNKLENGIFSNYVHDPNDPTTISQNHIRAIHEDRDGKLWIGTYSNGLDKFDRKKNIFYHLRHVPDDPNSLSDNEIRDIFEDWAGNLWIATWRGGLNRLDKKKGLFTHFKHDPFDTGSLSNNQIRTIVQSDENTLWIGTWGGGLNRLDFKSGHIMRFVNDPNNKNSLLDNRVLCIYSDSTRKILWIGTYGGGLNKLDLKNMQFTHYRKKDGLSDDVVYGIVEDENSNLWMSTDNGLTMFNTLTAKATVYDERDGLQSMEFSGGAYHQNKIGEIFFGGINGFNRFHPLSIQDNLQAPPVAITAFKIFNETFLHEITDIELAYDQNFISFEFSALDYTNSDKNQYAYFLQGIDKDWQYVDSNKRFANYTNLSPGEYKFRVKGSNNHGLWNEKGATVYVRIRPPFWQTWWFFALSGFGAISTILFVLNYRVKQKVSRLIEVEKIRMQESERVRKKAAEDFHDEIGHKSTKIALFSELLKANTASLSSETIELVDKITATSKSLSQGMRDFIWMLDPGKDDFYDLAVRLRDFGEELFEETDVTFHTPSISKHLQQVTFSLEQRRGIVLLFKEAMHNALKHAHCRKVDLQFELEKKCIYVSLQDDGQGFEPSKNSSGSGLKNMRHRAQNLSGHLAISTSPGKGTKIDFHIEIPNMNNK